MKKFLLGVLMVAIGLLLIGIDSQAQCSICTKTASDLNPDAARSLNAGILYLMITPLALVGFIGWRWWVSNKQDEDEGNANHE
ncbi:hypothetical protein [Thermoflavifilum thermophilum]|uniref:Uncharacterized protein n=1 Tax=Thermoflavifilum thermophilum TaxID=1393122 RepID=A0A1I7N866_9BACT|nr:hypothetical protein [Thermoflavifilum thermophilum]SFV30857.1 hypothetical protein SAMN05660895_0910 [Thermoflavifilum thermophilum]